MAYMNVDEIEAALDALAAANPDVAELVALPNSTAQGRRSHALRIGARDPQAGDAVMVTGGMHAREWVPPDALVYLAADLLEAFSRGSGLRYGGQGFSAEQIRDLVEGLHLVLFPCVNPDGRHHSQTAEPMWRKNRNRIRNDLGPGCLGVDLNRNFDALWDFRRHFAPDSGVSASDDPCHPQVYVGPAPTSEAESRNVVWLLDRYPSTRWFIDVHSYVPAIFYTWGFDENQTSDPAMSFLNPSFDGQRGRAVDLYREFIPGEDLETLHGLGRVMREAITAASGTDYELGQSFALYPTSGTSDDYAYSRHFTDGQQGKILSFCMECGRSFQPPWAEAEQVIIEVCAALVAFCTAVRQQVSVSASVAA